MQSRYHFPSDFQSDSSSAAQVNGMTSSSQSDFPFDFDAIFNFFYCSRDTFLTSRLSNGIRCQPIWNNVSIQPLTWDFCVHTNTIFIKSVSKARIGWKFGLKITLSDHTFRLFLECISYLMMISYYRVLWWRCYIPDKFVVFLHCHINCYTCTYMYICLCI